jgi:hypothetical protein
MPLPTVPKGKTHSRPPTRAIKKVHKKFGSTTHPHVSHTWQSKAKTKRKWVPQYVSISGKVVKGHYKTVNVKH